MFRVRNILCKGRPSSAGCSISAGYRDIVKNMRARSWVLGVAALFPALVFACGLDDSVIVPQGGSDAGVDGTIGSSQDGGTDGTTATGDGATNPDTGVTPPVLLVYATTETELYSFDVISGKLTDIGTLASCGAPTNFADLAVDHTGQLYMIKLGDGIYKMDATGNCSDRSVLMSTVGPNDGPNIQKISARNSGTPPVVALNTMNNDYYDIDLSAPNAAPLAKLNSDLFTDDPGGNQFGIYDLTCRQDGTCWTALAVGCTPGAGSSCLYTFQADGSTVATPLGAIGVEPAGLAYALDELYSFGADGMITKIDARADAGAPLARSVTTNGAALPATWTGAASNAGNP